MNRRDVKYATWEESYEKLKLVIKEEVDRTLTPILALLDEVEKRQYQELMGNSLQGPGLMVALTESLKFITKVYERVYEKKTIILLDEYDTPITHAYVNHFYDEMINFMRSLLSTALKGNSCLHRGFMTGVVRTAKDLNSREFCN